MKAMKYVVAGIVLTGLSLACFISHPTVKAGCEPRALPQSTSAAAAKKTGVPLKHGWRLGTPISFEKMTVFPVLSDQSAATRDFITLDEGLRSGKVIITEVGADGRSRRLRPGQEASEDADVNTLMLTNRSGKKLILIAGELVVGGNQDRMVAHVCIVASSRVPVSLDVFCVEEGRWEEREQFGRSNIIQPNNLGGTSVTSAGGVGGGGAGGVSGGTPGGVPGGIAAGSLQNFSMAVNVMAAPNVREKAQAAKDQSEVWTEVAQLEKANGVASATGNINGVFENKEVSANIDSYEHAFKNKLSDPRVVGVVVAVGGTLRSADVFANSRLFRSYWSKLLRSYALEAISTSDIEAQGVDSKTAEAFLARVGGEKSADRRRRAYKLTEHQSETAASFELVSTTDKQSRLIHFNRVTKD